MLAILCHDAVAFADHVAFHCQYQLLQFLPPSSLVPPYTSYMRSRRRSILVPLVDLLKSMPPITVKGAGGRGDEVQVRREVLVDTCPKYIENAMEKTCAHTGR